eukprot:765392-Hanusia_phi.AAC.1
MLDAVDAFAKDMRKQEDACLFAFIGHANELGSQDFLIPTRSELEDFTCTAGQEQAMLKKMGRFCMSFAEIQADFESSRENCEHHSIFVLDCCRTSCITPGASQRAPHSQLMNSHITVN